MAARSHVDVNERRLRLIYDCLDVGNNKKAIQEADKLLKKQKDHQCAKVLKAIALLHLGRHDESATILREVHAQHPTDEATLQAMLICYRETHKLELIANMYENAHKARPDSEEILSSLFMSYVRLGDYKRQQQTAISLHKLRPQKNPYYFWAIMSLVMQAHFTQDKKLAKSMFLPLAERMTQKYIKEEKIEAEAEVQLYLIILLKLEKWEEALKLLQGPLGEKFVSELNFRSQQVADLYCKLQRWHEANVSYRKLLEESPDNWLYWKQYLTSTFQLVGCDQDCCDKEQGHIHIDNVVEKAVQFVNKIVEQCGVEKPQRGPRLAQLELLAKDNCCATLLGMPLEMLKNYFITFGDRNCCFDDIKPYLTLLRDKEKEQFLDFICENVQLNSTNSPQYAQDLKQLQRHITYLRLKRYLGSYDCLSSGEKMVHVKDLLDRYRHSILFGKDLLQTDFQYCDPYLLLAVHLLLDIWLETGDDSVVWQIIVQLEKGLKYSSSSFQLKLLLIRLYCTMGAFGPCPELYDSMEVKHIMNDTLGYTVSNHVVRLGHFMAAHVMYGTMLRFFTVNHKETTDYLIASYKYGTFSKIYEFVQFRERLQNSLQYASATEERLLLDLVLETGNHSSTETMMLNMEIDPEKDKTLFDSLEDNRDFAVVNNWDPPNRYNMKEVQEKSFNEEKAWMKVRNLVLRILAAVVMIGRHSDSEGHTDNGVTNESKRPMHEVLEDLQQQLKSHLKDISYYKTPIKYPVMGPFPTRLSAYLSDNHHQIFTCMVDNVLYVHRLMEEGLDKIDEKEEEIFKSRVSSLMEGLVSKHKCNLINEENKKKTWNIHLLENIVLLSETISHVAVLAGVCHQILKPLKIAKTKKSKRKKDSNLHLPETFENFNRMMLSLEKSTHELHKIVTNINQVFLTLDLSSLNLTESITAEEDDTTIEKVMWKKAEESYQQSAQEVTELLHHKVEYLSSLHL